LLDYWPLRRLTLEAGKLKWVLLEKVPLFALTLASAAITIVAQGEGGAVREGANFPLNERIGNALVSYLMYVVQSIYPCDLAVLYPHPLFGSNGTEVWESVGAFIVLAILTFVCIRAGKTHPSLAVGWLWYLGMLVPVIGIVQVGLQARADRYTYLPQIGLCIGVTWYLAEILTVKRATQLSVLVLVVLGVLTWRQTLHWRDTESLFAHALAVTRSNWVSHTTYAGALWKENKHAEAMPHFRAAFQIAPDHARGRNNFLTALTLWSDELARKGEFESAAKCLLEALTIDPESGTTRKQLLMVVQRLGIMTARQGRPEEAVVWFHRAVELDQTSPTAHYNLGRALLDAGRPREASACFERVLELDPGNAAARANLQRLEQLPK
jgi:Tfp pilus assembly protein PilF